MFKNLHELTQKLNSEQACIDYLASYRWKDGVVKCVYCGHNKCYRIEGGKRFKCANKNCYKRFHVTVGTIFHASNIPLVKWFMAVYIGTAHKKGISSYQLGKDLGVTQKTAWFMLHRIREGMREKKPVVLRGTVEVDETYMSRKFRSIYKGLSVEMQEKAEEDYQKKHGKNKGNVVGMKERDGKIVVVATAHGTATELNPIIQQHIAPYNKVMTDEAPKYKNLFNDYWKQSVNHSAGEWVRDDIHTNGIENFWSVMKRGVYGIYHQISFKHLQAYCDEYSYRYNSRKIKDFERFNLTLTQVEGKLPYKILIGK